MKILIFLSATLLLAGCASDDPKPEDLNKLNVPTKASSMSDLMDQMGPQRIAGEISGEAGKGGKRYELLFLKPPMSKVPTTVAMYVVTGEKLKLIYSTPTPFGKNACDNNQCVFHYADYPYPIGFEISMVAVVGPQMRQDFLFKWENNDFRLIQRNIQWPQIVTDAHGQHTKCYQTENLTKGERREVSYPLERKTAMDQAHPQFLKADAVRFLNANEPNACAALGERPPGFRVIR